MPYFFASAITPSDAVDVTKHPTSSAVQAVYVGGAGALACTMSDGTNVTFAAVPAGTLLPIAPARVRATGTTATNLLALF